MFVLIRQNEKGFSAWKQGRENEWDGDRSSQCLWVTEALELGEDEDAMPAASQLQPQAQQHTQGFRAHQEIAEKLMWGVIFMYHRKKGLEGLVSKEKLKELNLLSLTRHQPGAGTGVGRD